MQDRRSPKTLVSLNKFKAQAAHWLRAIAAEDALTDQARFVSAVNEGNVDAEAGRVVDSDSLRTRFRARYGG